MAYNNHGTAYFGLGDYQRATNDYASAIAIKPSEGEFYANRAESRFLLMQRIEACADFMKSKQLGYVVDVANFPSSNNGAWCR